MMNTRFSCAIITGASSGLGAEFAQQLSNRCETIILVARREERLKDLARNLRSAVSGLSVLYLSADVSSEEGRKSVVDLMRELGLQPDLLINNAGLGDYGSFLSAEWSKIQSMIQVNIEALVYFSKAFLPSLIAQKGAMINISSLASQLSMPDFAVYAASKAFVSSFSEAIRSEVRDAGVRVVNVCPGPVATEFGDVARRSDFKGDLVPARDFFYTTQENVVGDAIQALDADQCTIYPNYKVKGIALLLKVLPRWVVNSFMYRAGRRASQSKN